MRHLLPVLLAVSALASCRTTPPAQPDRFADADTNKDGSLTGTEINHYFKAEWNPEMGAAEVRLFEANDANRDGKVTLAEAEARAKQKGTYTAITREADTNKDGTVSRAEATAYYASKEGPAR